MSIEVFQFRRLFYLDKAMHMYSCTVPLDLIEKCMCFSETNPFPTHQQHLNSEVVRGSKTNPSEHSLSPLLPSPSFASRILKTFINKKTRAVSGCLPRAGTCNICISATNFVSTSCSSLGGYNCWERDEFQTFAQQPDGVFQVPALTMYLIVKILAP